MRICCGRNECADASVMLLLLLRLYLLLIHKNLRIIYYPRWSIYILGLRLLLLLRKLYETRLLLLLLLIQWCYLLLLYAHFLYKN